MQREFFSTRHVIARSASLAAAILVALTLYPPKSATAASLAVDASSGAVLSADAPNHLWYPASLTKMMTIYVTLSEIEAGRLGFEDTITVSAHAAGISPVRFGLAAGETITVRQAINAAIVASGNDAATVLAERISGTDSDFAVLMTEAAHRLGMSRTTFRNPTGLPHNGQVTTAHDMALLALALLRDYPEHYALFNQRSVTIGRTKRSTVNGILGTYQGADGFKTGFTCGSGYNLVASAERGERRVIAILLGSKSRAERTTQMIRMLNAAFEVDAPTFPSLTELTMADAGAPPVVLAGGACSTAGDGESTAAASARTGSWGIVFGSFPDKQKAQQTLKQARQELGALGNAGSPTIARKAYEGVTRYSTMMLGLTRASAGKACKTLWAKNLYCLSLSPETIGTGGAWR